MPRVENRLLARLSPAERTRFCKRCEWVELTLSEALARPGEPSRYVYFPVTAYISMLALLDGKPAIEVAMVGSEGMMGARLVLGALPVESFHAIVQGAGGAWRMPVTTFVRELNRSRALRMTIGLYLQACISQLAATAACGSFHQLEPRLARWLLMTQDRARSKTFAVTQEFLSYMLGVRREGVTTSAAALQRRGLIRYRRGVLTVVSRRGLMSRACSCYAADVKSYGQLLR